MVEEEHEPIEINQQIEAEETAPAEAEEPLDSATQGRVNKIKEILVADYPDGRFIPHFGRIEAYARARIAMEGGDNSKMTEFNNGLTDDEFAQIQPAILLARQIMTQTPHGRHLERRKR